MYVLDEYSTEVLNSVLDRWNWYGMGWTSRCHLVGGEELYYKEHLSSNTVLIFHPPAYPLHWWGKEGKKGKMMKYDEI